MMLLAGGLLLGALVQPGLAAPQPLPNAYGHAFWNPPLRTGTYDELARFVGRAFRGSPIAVTVWDGRSAVEVHPVHNSSLKVSARTIAGSNETFVQRYQAFHPYANGLTTWLVVSPDQMRPTVDVPITGAGSGVWLFGPPGSMPLNGTNVTEKARAFAAEMDLSYDDMTLHAPSATNGSGPGFLSIYNSFWKCPSDDAAFCASFRSIVFDGSNCTYVDMRVGSDNSTHWFQATFGAKPLIHGTGPGGARLCFYHDELVAAGIGGGYELNVSSMLAPATAVDRLQVYLASRGYGVNQWDLQFQERLPGIYLLPTGSRWFNVTSTAYSWREIYLYNLSLARGLYGDGAVPPAGVGRPAQITDPTLRELYTRTDLVASVYQDTITGAVTNITYSHWVNASGPAQLGGGPGGLHVPSVGVAGVAAALAVALALVGRRRQR